MSKKQFKALTAVAVASAVVVPVAPFATQAASEAPTNGVYFYSETGGKYIGAVEFASLTDEQLNALLSEFGSENIHAVYDGEYLSLAGAMDGKTFAPYEGNEIPSATYTNITPGEEGKDITVGGDTSEENLNETFFYNLVA